MAAHCLPNTQEEVEVLRPDDHFNNDDRAREFLEAQRWPDGPVCPHCGQMNSAYRLQRRESRKGTHVRKGVWKCRVCREQFSVTVGTIFEDSHIPLDKWLLTMHLLCSSEKGISAHQLHRILNITYRSAWYMGHRIRYAMAQEPLASKLVAGRPAPELARVHCISTDTSLERSPACQASAPEPADSVCIR